MRSIRFQKVCPSRSSFTSKRRWGRLIATAVIAALAVTSFAYRNGIWYSHIGPFGSETCFEGYRWNGTAWVRDNGPTQCWQLSGIGVGGSGAGQAIGVFNGNLAEATYGFDTPASFGWSPGEMNGLSYSETGVHYMTLVDSPNVLRSFNANVSGSAFAIGSGQEALEDLDEDRFGQLWGVSSAHLLRIDKQTGAQIVVSNLSIQSVGLAVRDDGGFWIADAHSIYSYELANGSLTSVATFSETLTDLGSSPVPEPATLATCVIALSTMMGMNRLRRRKG